MDSLFGDPAAIAKMKKARREAELEELVEDESVEKEFELSVEYDVIQHGIAVVKVRARSLNEAEGMVSDDLEKYVDLDCHITSDDWEVGTIDMQSAKQVDASPTVENKTLSLFANLKSN